MDTVPLKLMMVISDYCQLDKSERTATSVVYSKENEYILGTNYNVYFQNDIAI